MHACEIRMRYDWDTEDDDLDPCGEPARKKLGQLWACDDHFKLFQSAVNMDIRFACDSSNAPQDPEEEE